ncbi:MAG: hypothetical protein ACOC2W_01430 [bacterium]
MSSFDLEKYNDFYKVKRFSEIEKKLIKNCYLQISYTSNMKEDVILTSTKKYNTMLEFLFKKYGLNQIITIEMIENYMNEQQ